MAWKIISLLIVLMLVFFSLSVVFDNLPRKSVNLKINYLEPESVKLVEYGATPIFAENLRFNHNLISYSIDENCDEDRISDMIAAFNIFSDEVGVISFYEFPRNYDSDLGKTKSDIRVLCSNEFIKLDNNLFAAGEGGPSRIINSSGFKVIEEGKVILYNGADCNYPIVALHELCHVFGFDHSKDPKNIMYNVSNCNQRMSPDMGELMRKLYSIEALANLRIDNATAVVHGRYLDFNISILNEGLIDVDYANLTIIGDGKFVSSIDLGEFNIGYGRTLRVQNMKIDPGLKKIEFIVDAENVVKELNENDNKVEMGF